jgi:hypothetical protein
MGFLSPIMRGVVPCTADIIVDAYSSQYVRQKAMQTPAQPNCEMIYNSAQDLDSNSLLSSSIPLFFIQSLF